MKAKEMFQALIDGHVIQGILRPDAWPELDSQFRLGPGGDMEWRYRKSESWTDWGSGDLGTLGRLHNARIVKLRTRDDVARNPMVGDAVVGHDMSGCTRHVVYVDERAVHFWVSYSQGPDYPAARHRRDWIGMVAAASTVTPADALKEE